MSFCVSKDGCWYPTGSPGAGQHAAVPDSILWQPPLPDPRLRLGERGRHGEGEAGESAARCTRSGFPAGEEMWCRKKMKSSDRTAVGRWVGGSLWAGFGSFFFA